MSNKLIVVESTAKAMKQADAIYLATDPDYVT